MKESTFGSVIRYDSIGQGSQKLHYLQYKYLRSAIRNHMYAGNYSPRIQLLPKPSEDLRNWNEEEIHAAEELKFEKEVEDEVYSEYSHDSDS